MASYKLSTLIRATLIIGTAGTGGVALSTKAKTNNTGSAIVTTAGYALDVIPYNGVAGSTNLVNNQYPYTAAQFTAGSILGRVVTTAVRVRYIGTELNRSGRIILWKVSNAVTMGAQPSNSVLAYNSTITRPCDRQWHGLSYTPARPDDYTYDNQPYDVVGGTNLSMGIQITGADVGNAFELEIKQYHEIIPGLITPPNVTPTHSDVLGFSAIRNFLEGKNFEIGASAFKNLIKLLRKYGPSEASHFTRSIMGSPMGRLQLEL